MPLFTCVNQHRPKQQQQQTEPELLAELKTLHVWPGTWCCIVDS